MTFVSGLLGGCIGFGCQVFANSARKVPLSRQPWIHVSMFFAGAYVGSKLPKIEHQLVVDINELRAARGLSPMIGTNAWIRYQPKDEDDLDDKKIM